MPNGIDIAALSRLFPRNDVLQSASRVAPPSFFEGAFGGPDDPRMDPATLASARRAATLRAGFAGLLAAGQGANPLETLGQAGLAGIEARMAMNQAFEPPETQELKTQVVEIVDPETGHTRRVLINKQTGEEIADLGLAEIHEDDLELGQPVKVQLPSGDVVFAFPDKKNGYFRDTNGQILVNAVPIPEKRVADVTTFFDPATGKEYQVYRDRATGEAFGPRWQKKPTADGDGDLGEMEAQIKTIERRVDEIDDIYADRGYEAFGLKDVITEKYDTIRGVLTSDEYKVAAPAQKFVASAVLKAIQGSRPSDFDMKMYLDFIIPRVGDNPEAIRAKIRRLREMVADLRNLGDVEGGKAAWQRVREHHGLVAPDGEGPGAPEPVNHLDAMRNWNVEGGE
jgi:hypothetical protein